MQIKSKFLFFLSLCISLSSFPFQRNSLLVTKQKTYQTCLWRSILLVWFAWVNVEKFSWLCLFRRNPDVSVKWVHWWLLQFAYKLENATPSKNKKKSDFRKKKNYYHFSLSLKLWRISNGMGSQFKHIINS